MHETDETQLEDDVGRFLYAVANADVKRWPYRHFIVSGLLDPAWIEELRDADLSGLVGRLREQRKSDYYNENRYGVPLLPDTPDAELPGPLLRLRGLFGSHDVARCLLGHFSEHVGTRLRKVDGRYRTRLALDFMEDRTGYEIEPHTDARQKLITMLLYLDDEPAGTSLGTSIYTPRGSTTGDAREGPKRDRFVRVATVPFRANSAVCFGVTSKSFHGVERVTASGARRRLVQFHVLADNPADLV